MAEKNSLKLAQEYAEKNEWANAYMTCVKYDNAENDEDEQVFPMTDEELELYFLKIKSCLKCIPFELLGKKVSGEDISNDVPEDNFDKLIEDLEDTISFIVTYAAIDDNRIAKFEELHERVFKILNDEFLSMLDGYIDSVPVDDNSGTNHRCFLYRTGYTHLCLAFMKHIAALADVHEFNDYKWKGNIDEILEIEKNKYFEKAKSIINKISTRTTEFPYFDDQNVAYMYINAVYYLDISLPKKDDENKSKRIARLKSAINIRCDVLNAIYVDTAREIRRSLLPAENTRNNYYSQILEFEKEIQEAESGYTHPNVRREVYSSVPLTNNSGSGGCYVATAVYGSYDCPEVWTLRRFRDNTLAKSWYGRAFIRTYYAVSPTLVKWFGHTQWFKKLWQGKLDKMVAKLQSQGVESTPYQDINW